MDKLTTNTFSKCYLFFSLFVIQKPFVIDNSSKSSISKFFSFAQLINAIALCKQ